MNLVAYSSESEGSDSEAPPAPKQTPKPASGAKPAFEKVVDRANPRKIRVNLPSNSPAQDGVDADAPPAKKARIGGGGTFSGFNSFLPAPKKTGQLGGTKKGLGSGVSLKTGAAPAFSREPMAEPDFREEGPEDVAEDWAPVADTQPAKPAEEKAQEDKPKSNPLMFKPMSVQNNARKKKKAATAKAAVAPDSGSAVGVQGKSTPNPQAEPAQASKPKKPKVSLFSISKEDSSTLPTSSGAEYQPLLYKTEETTTFPETETPDSAEHISHTSTSTSANPSATQDLSAIAADLNLTEAERRQLFGRQRGKNGPPELSAINVVNFNTDHEYQANEELRAAGETIQHNPVRGLAPGKHSLKQLVSAASTNKEALEESFATGRRNKKEAGSRYGW